MATAIVKSLGFYTRRSFALHVLLILAVIGINHWQGIVVENRKKENLILINSSVKVDVVAMPRMTLKELKAVGADVSMNDSGKTIADDVKEEKAPPPAPAKEEGNEFIKKKKFKSFKDLLKKYNKNENIGKKEISTGKNKLSLADRNKLKNLVMAGNKLSGGTAISGSAEAGLNSEFASYLSRFPDWVKPNWKLPGYLLEKELQCRIRVYLSASGSLVRVEIFQSSGDNDYDRRAMEAVKRSAPFPVPPTAARSRVLNGDIVLGFPL